MKKLFGWSKPNTGQKQSNAGARARAPEGVSKTHMPPSGDKVESVTSSAATQLRALRVRNLYPDDAMSKFAAFWETIFRWSPFILSLFFLLAVVNQVQPNIFNLDFAPPINVGGSGPEVTPEQPPILYEEGIEPHANADDRVPVSALSEEYELNDPQLPGKLSGVGALYVDGGRCTASVVGRRDFVVTAAHCIPPPGIFFRGNREVNFYSVACDAFYEADTYFQKTHTPDRNIDLDYAFVKLKQPVCDATEPFQAVTLTDEAAQNMRDRNYPLLSLSVFPFDAVRRHNEFPLAEAHAQDQFQTLTPFGVFCRFSKPRINTSAPEATLVYYTDGCDTFPGNSGGPLLVSLDGGKTYRILATLFGHNRIESLFPRVKGAFAADLERHFSEWAGEIES